MCLIGSSAHISLCSLSIALLCPELAQEGHLVLAIHCQSLIMFDDQALRHDGSEAYPYPFHLRVTTSLDGPTLTQTLEVCANTCLMSCSAMRPVVHMHSTNVSTILLSLLWARRCWLNAFPSFFLEPMSAFFSAHCVLLWFFLCLDCNTTCCYSVSTAMLQCPAVVLLQHHSVSAVH